MLQPDIVVFTAGRAGLIDLDKVIRVPPDVAVEVISPSTETNDRRRKLRMFEQFGVREYWIDPGDRRIEVRTISGVRGRVTVSEAGRQPLTAEPGPRQ